MKNINKGIKKTNFFSNATLSIILQQKAWKYENYLIVRTASFEEVVRKRRSADELK